jgi:hypothetical protein
MEASAEIPTLVGVADWSLEFWAMAEQPALSSTAQIVIKTIRIGRAFTCSIPNSA